MRIVAVGALHESLVYAMLERHRKLRALRRMAGIAQFGLLHGQEEFRCRRLVNRVAIGADYVFFSVPATANVRSRQGIGVTAEASVENFLRRHARKRVGDGRRAAPGRYVRCAGSLTAFAAVFSGGSLPEAMLL